jgi:hypothetical protein
VLIVAPTGAPVRVAEIVIFVFITAATPPLALSLAVTFGTVPPVDGRITAASSKASTVEATAATTDPVQGVATVHVGSPPPVTVAVLFPPVGPATAVAPTVIGTVTVIGPIEFAGIEQLDKLAQLPSAAPLTSSAPLVVMPVGNVSTSVIAAVVGPFNTFIVMV